MRTNLRIGNIAGSLAALLCACTLVACTTQENNNGTGGSGGGGGNTVPPGNGGAGGTTTPATSAGSDGTLCPLPSQVITDFTYAPSDAGVSTSEVRFGGTGLLTGGENYYPTSAGTLTSDVTKSNWHISGTVSDYSGFALYLDGCDHIDASKYKGLRFTISGSVQGNAISLAVGTIIDKTTAAWLQKNGSTSAKLTDSGKCTPSSDTSNQYYHPGCADPTAQIAVSATPTQVDVPWANLVGGSPQASVTPSELTSIAWILPWSSGGTPYPVDLVLDDLQFIP